jgi:hypothetical protein
MFRRNYGMTQSLVDAVQAAASARNAEIKEGIRTVLEKKSDPKIGEKPAKNKLETDPKLKLTTEEVELDEMSKGKLQNYARAAITDIGKKLRMHGRKGNPNDLNAALDRKKHFRKALSKIATKEEFDLAAQEAADAILEVYGPDFTDAEKTMITELSKGKLLQYVAKAGRSKKDREKGIDKAGAKITKEGQETLSQAEVERIEKILNTK